MIAFGPVPSRRLGRSLGINNIPPKTCSYSCIYCQLGRTSSMAVERKEFYQPQEIARSVQEKVEDARKAGEAIDYLTFVADGEPTLDSSLGHEMELLRPLGIKIAVISNASLITDAGVRADLLKADWVSLKVDSVSGEAWRKVNRPHGSLQLAPILESAVEFGGRLQPDVSYISIPTRPPAEERARAPAEEGINRAWQILSQQLDHVEYLIGYEGDGFAFTGDVESDLLSITSVHPMREDAVREFLAKADADWGTVRRLMNENRLVETPYGGRKFYVRKLA
jgi:wyosine [tRNA(Phe)-imidazoG37] synthetase (radical SAM superfamily)